MADLTGQTLDDKYRIEHEIGRGGMGTVYFATHLGTERPVALKIVAPQFMKRPEFVERFRREARAAGRLRHPNVVDVTDFGFANTLDGPVAYLVMEYLDGCTLGEILAEEKHLPVDWTLDILEQICSAVGAAHKEGIIHRDLKPDNIWLEPNRRGGYTVKVLDFGIAKLEEAAILADTGELPQLEPVTSQTTAGKVQITLAEAANATAAHEGSLTAASADATALFAGRTAIRDGEAGTMLLPADDTEDQENIGTQIISADPAAASVARSLIGHSSTGSDLTRVGAVLGTPLYMSPEQVRGDRLDPRSDIYSLGVIGYQMLSGRTPFEGKFDEVMEAHKTLAAPPLKAKKVRRKLKGVISSALSKDPDGRPNSAEDLANRLRSRSEGVFGLLRRAGMIYTENIRHFISVATLYFVPIILITTLMVVVSFLHASDIISSTANSALLSIAALLMTVITAFCTYLIIGTTTWIVTQKLAIPLRPIHLRSVLAAADRKWRSFATTGVLSTIIQFVLAPLISIPIAATVFAMMAAANGIGAVSFVTAAVVGAFALMIGFFGASVGMMLVAPVVMMEDLRGIAAIKRSLSLVKRSAVTSIATFFLMFSLPVIAASSISFFTIATAKAFYPEIKLDSPKKNGVSFSTQTTEGENDASISLNPSPQDGRSEGDISDRLRRVLVDMLMQICLLPIQILTASFTSVMVALLYLKTRQAGGESLRELLSNFEESEYPQKKWQLRMRRKVVNSGRTPSTGS